jgi:hypothetical protein
MVSSLGLKKKLKKISRCFGNPSQSVSHQDRSIYIFTTHNSTANKPHAGFIIHSFLVCLCYISTPHFATNPFCFSLLLPPFSQGSLLPFALPHQELWLLCTGAHRGIIQVRPTQPRRKSCLVYSSKLACPNPRQNLNRRFVYCSES